jgi:hypothetical protein
VVVPDELALELDDLDVGVVQLGDDLGAPGLVEERELLGDLDLLEHCVSIVRGETPPPARRGLEPRGTC